MVTFIFLIMEYIVQKNKNTGDAVSFYKVMKNCVTLLNTLMLFEVQTLYVQEAWELQELQNC